MAPTATNGETPVGLDDLKPPQGVVLPPREIRNVLEKTAGYVARNGLVFEDRIRDKERQNPKFSFLDAADPYNAFYQWRLDEIRGGRGTLLAAGRAGEAPVEQKPKGPPKPPEFQFSARMPRISQKDLDVLRLTALFVARNGRSFMTQLAQREASNPQFQFLIPSHTFHNYFQHTVDQYTTILRASGLDGEGGRLEKQRIAELQQNVEDKFHLLTRANQRAEYLKYEAAEKLKKEEEEEKQKQEFEQIDWGDFVVVETITFSEVDEQANLPPPTTLSDLQYASLEDRKTVSISSSMRLEEAMPTDDDFSYSSYNAYPAQPMYPMAPPSGYAPQQYPTVQLPYVQPAQEDTSIHPAKEETEPVERVDTRAPAQRARVDTSGRLPNVKIKENYVPRAAQRAAASQDAASAKCPNCGEMIPLNEMERHLRIELLDPSWKEQKAKAESRYSSTNLSTVDVANNLKRLASQRTDVFDGVSGEPISEDELARRKKAAVHSFDGNLEGKTQAHIQNLQKVSVEEQIRAIHQRFADK